MLVNTVRNFSKRKDALSVPHLVSVQQEAYARFLQRDKTPEERNKALGLESLFQEVFPIEGYDGQARIEYVSYRLEAPRYTPDECRELRLTYGVPLKVNVRLLRKGISEVIEDTVYLGDVPLMLGGGEYIINGSERCIVNQLHRSPGVDFSLDGIEAGKELFKARVVPERGSWIELVVTKKDTLVVCVDQKERVPATTFLRALDESLSTTESLLRHFYGVEKIKVTKLTAEHYVASAVIDSTTGEELLAVGARVGDKLDEIITSPLKDVEVVTGVVDPLILNTIADESQLGLPDGMQYNEADMAMLRLYSKLRPGNPPQVNKARDFFKERFMDDARYRLGRVGRFRLNRKFGMDVSEEQMQLRAEDYCAVIEYLHGLRSGQPDCHMDDIDHLGNRRLRALDELAVEEVRKGFLKLRRSIQEKMSTKPLDEVTRVSDLVNTKTISGAIDSFFGRSELSQVVDQTNPLSQLTHERRLSALGPGGLSRKHAGFDVRDVHISHYGRVCPIETPEGANIGLICTLSIYSSVDEYGFLQTPYRKVENGKVTDEVVYLRADEEIRRTLAPCESLAADGTLNHETNDLLLARVDGEMSQVQAKQIEYVDISPKQIVGVSAALIPFLEHDDANRALMGSNMQRQAVPLLKVEPPVVATGMEREVPKYSGMLLRAINGGVVTYVDSERIVIDHADEYELRKFKGLNERTCQNQRPIVQMGETVEEGQIIADGAATKNGELALGKSVMVAFNTFDGYNFEDAIVISERLVKEDVYTSIHIESFEVEVRETKLGREQITSDIPNVSERQLSMLDENGIIHTGARIKPNDILVGKVAPKNKSELSPEEKLLHAIFGRAGEDVKNESLTVPSGTEGVVIGTKRFRRHTHLTDDQKREIERDRRTYEADADARIIELFRQFIDAVNEEIGSELVDPSTRQKVAQSDIPEIVWEQIEDFELSWVKGSKEVRESVDALYAKFWPRIEGQITEKTRRLEHMKRGDELPIGVLEKVIVYVAIKRPLSVGDKMAGRHGNKGVIARVVPVEDMPFLEDGTAVDVLLNPLGVPSRMNVGQILEVHLGWACSVLGIQAVTPVFDGATEDEVHGMIEEANAHVDKRMSESKGAHGDRELLARMPYGGKVQLYDGRTGEAFDQRTTVGFMYILKLHHLVDEKINARSTGTYSLITQQPLGGKARLGGQRFGEMEVWALEAYGAAYILQEMLTVKSDDVEGRTKIYDSMVRGKNTLEAGMPMAFDVLVNEVKGLGLNIGLKRSDDNLDFLS